LTAYSLGFVLGTFIHKLIDRYLAIEIVIEIEEDPPAEKRELELNLFDCPACGLPAEINTIVTQLSQEGFFVTNYIIDCCGQHDRVAVTENWLAENTGGI